MLNYIWLGLILISVVVGAFNGTIPAVVASVTDSAKIAITIALGLIGIMAFWLGLMKIADQSGLITILARAIRPIMKRLFPDVPAEHPAMGSMILNIASNMLGLTNAATPFGLRAMRDLETLNKRPGIATDAMCTFLAINTSSVQLIPTTAIALLASAGSHDPTSIISTSLIATTCSTIAGITAVKFFAKLPVFKIKKRETIDVAAQPE